MLSRNLWRIWIGTYRRLIVCAGIKQLAFRVFVATKAWPERMMNGWAILWQALGARAQACHSMAARFGNIFSSQVQVLQWTHALASKSAAKISVSFIINVYSVHYCGYGVIDVHLVARAGHLCSSGRSRINSEHRALACPVYQIIIVSRPERYETKARMHLIKLGVAGRYKHTYISTNPSIINRNNILRSWSWMGWVTQPPWNNNDSNQNPNGIRKHNKEHGASSLADTYYFRDGIRAMSEYCYSY